MSGVRPSVMARTIQGIALAKPLIALKFKGDVDFSKRGLMVH